MVRLEQRQRYGLRRQRRSSRFSAKARRGEIDLGDASELTGGFELPIW